MDYCTVYLSSAVEVFQEDDLAVILNQSRRFNGESGITGVLLYTQGSIIQVLEGEKATVDSLFRRIEKDRRHKQITRVLNQPITHRLFSSWSMGYETITAQQLEAIELIIDIGNSEGLADDTDDHMILRLIKVFYKSHHYHLGLA